MARSRPIGGSTLVCSVPIRKHVKPLKNTLPYYNTALIVAAKSFIVQPHKKLLFAKHFFLIKQKIGISSAATAFKWFSLHSGQNNGTKVKLF